MIKDMNGGDLHQTQCIKMNNIPKLQSASHFTQTLLITPTFDQTHHKSDSDQKKLFHRQSNKTQQDVAEE